MTTLVWCQRELRLQHNLALQMALKQPGLVIFGYFHDPKNCIGGRDSANTLWLAQALQSLQQAVANRGGALWILEGDFSEQFAALITEYKITEVLYSFQPGEPFSTQQTLAQAICQTQNVKLTPLYSEFLIEPSQFSNQQGKPYLVFTPFYKALIKQADHIHALDAAIPDLKATAQIALPEKAKTLPSSLNALLQATWAKPLMAPWQISENAAWQTFENFLEQQLTNYAIDRDFPALDASSHLSPYLHFGQISIKALFHECQARTVNGSLSAESVMPWLRQLVWKEFARHLLCWFPQTQTLPFQTKYNAMNWTQANPQTQAWQLGQTGIPIIDAGMRELWATGTLHNRVRMLVASLLTKNLQQHWLLGKAWFDFTLFDADPANNVMGWQWVAGCGVDAAPYYRLFNPVTQSVKFDEHANYIRRWVPELKRLSNKAIHAPWEHLSECQIKGIELGKTYPKPLVNLAQSRLEHLE
ncbi:MAG: deoxyribodipyrimidine photo-lyase, partial [Thiotrichales bacterium]|nr:deoxyribodipyrimidine photo-lyase [Thiotrichales bacterium]